MIRTKIGCQQKKGFKVRDGIPYPSGPPVAYSICVGWNTNELERGINGDGRPRTGGPVKPLETLNADKTESLVNECTAMRWDLQCTGVIVEFL
jgi:hypothetical protein